MFRSNTAGLVDGFAVNERAAKRRETVMNKIKMPPAFTAQLRAFAADQRGATVVEYGLIVSAVGLTIISAVFTTSDGLKTTFQKAIDFFSTFNG